MDQRMGFYYQTCKQCLNIFSRDFTSMIIIYTSKSKMNSIIMNSLFQIEKGDNADCKGISDSITLDLRYDWELEAALTPSAVGAGTMVGCGPASPGGQARGSPQIYPLVHGTLYHWLGLYSYLCPWWRVPAGLVVFISAGLVVFISVSVVACPRGPRCDLASII